MPAYVEMPSNFVLLISHQYDALIFYLYDFIITKVGELFLSTGVYPEFVKYLFYFFAIYALIVIVPSGQRTFTMPDGIINTSLLEIFVVAHGKFL
jgi:hypothetical protein